MYSFTVPVFSVPSELNNLNDHIVSSSGASLNAEDTVKEETFPADVVTVLVSILTFSEQKNCTLLFESSL